MNLTPTTEPVAITAALTAAIQATLGILLLAGVDPDVVAACQGAAVAWILVFGLLVRARVTPFDRGN